MSTNGIYGQMQAWLNKNEVNFNSYSDAMYNIQLQIDDMTAQLQAGLNNKEAMEDLSNKIYDIEIQQLEAQLNYLKGEQEAGRKFNFMEGSYDCTDADTFIPAYIEQTGKLAQGDMDAWETDGQDGISLNEYKAAQIGDFSTSGMSRDEYRSANMYATQSFYAIDADGDGIIEKNELQGFYAALDNADGRVDGEIDINASNIDFRSQKFASNIREFQAYLNNGNNVTP